MRTLHLATDTKIVEMDAGSQQLLEKFILFKGSCWYCKNDKTLTLGIVVYLRCVQLWTLMQSVSVMKDTLEIPLHSILLSLESLIPRTC